MWETWVQLRPLFKGILFLQRLTKPLGYTLSIAQECLFSYIGYSMGQFLKTEELSSFTYGQLLLYPL